MTSQHHSFNNKNALRQMAIDLTEESLSSSYTHATTRLTLLGYLVVGVDDWDCVRSFSKISYHLVQIVLHLEISLEWRPKKYKRRVNQRRSVCLVRMRRLDATNEHSRRLSNRAYSNCDNTWIQQMNESLRSWWLCGGEILFFFFFFFWGYADYSKMF